MKYIDIKEDTIIDGFTIKAGNRIFVFCEDDDLPEKGVTRNKMLFTLEQKARLEQILIRHTYPKEQFGFFTMDQLIKLIEEAL